MKAITCPAYGFADVLQLRDLDKPVPSSNEVLVKVHAASITAADSMMRRGIPGYARLFLGLTRPSNPVPGSGFSGVIESVGAQVDRFEIGDAVFGETGVNFGAHAEYICLPQEAVIIRKPQYLDFDQAATMCDGPLTSLNFLTNLAHLEAGQSILIIGASGSLGSAAIQLAKHIGARVTGVCSTANIDMVKSLGADQVIDYSEQDLTECGLQFDCIYDTTGKHDFTTCRDLLTKKGIYMSSVLSVSLLWQMACSAALSHKKARFSATGLLPYPQLNALLHELTSMVEAGSIRPVIDRRYTLEQAIEANRYVDSGHKKSNIVFSMS